MKIGSLELNIRKTSFATLKTIFGVGSTKAKRLSSFLLLSPTSNSSKLDFDKMIKDPVGYNFLHHMPVSKRLRLNLAHIWARKFETPNYKAFRMVLGYPANGQRTHANSKTPRRFNPYLNLKVELETYKVAQGKYKLKELFDNERFDEHKQMSQSLLDNTKSLKFDQKFQKKQAKEKFYRNQKTNNKFRK